jgi:hypothetical protein
LSFLFAGTSISVYGIFSWNKPGALSATFAVDGAPIPQTYNQTDVVRDVGETPNFLFYSLDDLSAGNHTLIVSITAANNRTFILDYITYTPSFATLSSMPFLNITSAAITSVSVDPPISSGNQPSQVQVSGTPQPSHGSLPTAAIVGGVIGVLVLGVLVAMIALLLRGRKAKQTNKISQFLYTPTDERNYQNGTLFHNSSIVYRLIFRRTQPRLTKEAPASSTPRLSTTELDHCSFDSTLSKLEAKPGSAGNRLLFTILVGPTFKYC